jgi:hypothetical protein
VVQAAEARETDLRQRLAIAEQSVTAHMRAAAAGPSDHMQEGGGAGEGNVASKRVRIDDERSSPSLTAADAAVAVRFIQSHTRAL